MHDPNDWRLNGQDRYLPKGAVWFLRPYLPANPRNDHDHCEFCAAKFMRDGAHGTLAEGWTTPDRDRWICKVCFGDFRERFDWRMEIPAAGEAKGLL